MTPSSAPPADSPPRLELAATVRLPSGRFATVLEIYRLARGVVEVLVAPEGGEDDFRIRACHLRGLP